MFMSLLPGTLAASLSALVTLVPAAALAVARDPKRDAWFWVALVLALAGPAALAASALAQAWRSDLATALWLSVAATLALYLVGAVLDRAAAALAPLLLPYLLLLALLATAFHAAAGPPKPLPVPLAWMAVHVGVSVATYGLLTLSAVAALAVFLKERALKGKTSGRLVQMLPAVRDGERLQALSLRAAALVLGAGIATGMALQLYETGRVLVPDHKTVLSLTAFVVIVGLLAGQARFGVRGRLAARLVLLAWLLVTLAYPGVKFVSDVLVSRGA